MNLSMGGPKIHGVEDHFVEQIKEWKGMRCFIEDCVEQAYQLGIREEARTRGMLWNHQMKAANSSCFSTFFNTIRNCVNWS